MFWEDTSNNYDSQEVPIAPKKCFCPVCKEYLGLQEHGMEVSKHCEECRAWFTWFPGVDKPISKLDKDIPEQCNCLSCQSRRGE